MTAREVLDGIKARQAYPVENYNFIQQAAAENQLLKVDMPRLTAALEAVLMVIEDRDHSKDCDLYYAWREDGCTCWQRDINAAIEGALKEGQ